MSATEHDRDSTRGNDEQQTAQKLEWARREGISVVFGPGGAMMDDHA